LYLIKRYGRSRVYHPANGCDVSIDDLRQWQREGVAFAVMDTETGADVTRVLLVSPAPSGAN
jgi:polyhydroxyalkanoate synthesis regulator protein